MQATGCLLIGKGSVPERLCKQLSGRDVSVVHMTAGRNLLAEAQRGLYEAARGGKRACVAAEGEMWAAALALGIQLNVDRIVLLFPRDGGEVRDKSLERLKAYVMRNLFFCVSDVLVIEDGASGQSADRLCRRLINARVWRLHADETDAAVCAAERFLLGEDLSEIAVQ